MKNTQIYFSLGQTILGICLAVCAFIIPSYFLSSDQGGVSNYGTSDRTAWWFTGGFAAAAVGALAAAGALPSSARNRGTLRLFLVLLGILYAVVLGTTFSYKLSDSNREWHQLASLALFAVMLAAATWARFVTSDKAVRLAFILLLLGLAAGVLTLTGVLHILFIVQIFCGLVFAYLFARTIGVLTK